MKRALRASVFLSSGLLAIDASAEPLVWGSGVWGDAWQLVIAVPTLSPMAVGLLAASLSLSMLGVRVRRRVSARARLANGDRR
jgi:hypothetical protein